jgi:hypothetical protein
MNDIDALLHGAGERWRASLSDPPTVDPAAFTGHARPSVKPLLSVATVGLAAVVVVGLVAVAIGLGRAPGVGGPPLGAPSPAASAAEVNASSTPEASPSASFTCDVTRPTDPFVPPEGYPAEPPPGYDAEWYGTPALWTMLDRDGETWAHLPVAEDGRLSQKTFWWSTDWVPEADPEPNITVVGTRLDSPWTFRVNPGTNASADFGTAMLVGVTLPSPGCWRLTATYLDASLSIVVLVEGD